jgi:hypothetical protein
MSTALQKPQTAINPDRVIAGVALAPLGFLLPLRQMGYRAAGEIIGGWWPIPAFGS